MPLGHRPRSPAGPEWMVLTALPVPPVTVRPSITLETGERSEDDLTHKLVDVLRINQRLRENRDAGAPQLIVEDLWELLQYHVTTYFDNQTSRHPAGEAPLGPPAQDARPEAEGQGRPVPFEPVGKARQLLRPHGHLARTRCSRSTRSASRSRRRGSSPSRSYVTQVTTWRY